MRKKIKLVLKETIIYGFGGAGNKFISFLLFPVFSRSMSIADYGILEILQLFILLAGLLITSGTEVAQSFFFYEYPSIDDRKKTISTLCIYILCATLLLGFILWIFSKKISFFLFGDEVFFPLMRISVITIPLMSLYTFNLNLLRLKRKPIIYVFINLPAIFLILCSNIIIAFRKMYGISGILWSNWIIYFIFCIISIIYNRQFYGQKFNFDLFKSMFNYWRPLIPVGISAWLLGSGDRIFLSSTDSIVSVGAYAAGFRLASIVGFFGQAFRTANLPFIFDVSKEDDADLIYSKTLTYYSLFMSTIAICISLFSEPLMLFLGGSSFVKVSYLVAPLSFIFILSGVSQIVSIGSLISKNTRFIGLITTSSAGLLFLLLALGNHLFGLFGIALATLMANFIYTLLLLYRSQKVYQINFEYKKILVLISLCILIIITRSLISVDEILHKVFISIYFFIIYIASLLFLS